MQIVQAVYGVFHHFELAHQLHRRGYLRRIYSTWPWARLKREGLPSELVRTFPLVHTGDYLLRQTPFYSAQVESRLNEWNSLAFDAWLCRNLEPCDALIAISGAGQRAGPLFQAAGGKFICDRGSTHQRVQNQILTEEYARWNLPRPVISSHMIDREEAIYAAADAITVPSSVARRSFLRMGTSPEKVHIIPYGVSLERFLPSQPPPAESFQVLFAGLISLRKGVPYLLEAFARLKHPYKRLTLVGAMHRDMLAIVRKLPTEHVEFAGILSQAELSARMSRSHVLALPSVEEGLALVQGQALACGCPVIATRATGAEDLFTDGIEGFIIDDRNTNALTDRLQQLADDSALRERMSDAAIERMRSLRGWDAYGDHWDNLLHMLTGSPRGNSDSVTSQD